MNLFGVAGKESIALAQNCWRGTTPNGIHLPPYVVIVDDVEESETTPIRVLMECVV